MGDAVIRIEGVAKKYCRTLKHSMLYGVSDLARSFLGIDQSSHLLRQEEFWAVNHISFEVKRGETLGIIGANGSGKSTLLKMLNGIFMPDKGRIEIEGRVGALIEVGAGFHPMLTGRENIYINGSIYGMSKREIDSKFDNIVEFAGIGDFLDSPVKHYSSGMFVRLGFSVAVHSEPDILLVDEVLAVGDENFKIKCYEQINKFQQSGKTIFYVTHDLTSVKKICTQCLWLKAGTVEMFGNSAEVVDRYIDYMKSNLTKKTNQITNSTTPIEITKIWTEDAHGNEKVEFEFGETVTVRIKYQLLSALEPFIFGIAIYTADNICISALHTGLDGIELKQNEGNYEVSIDYPSIKLLSGTYWFDIGFFEKLALGPLQFMSRVVKIYIRSPFVADGILVLEHIWKSS